MSNLPTWLIDAREHVLHTNEWNDVTTNIYDAVDQHLAQSHVQYFTDLSDPEKSLVLERAARSLKSVGGSNPYDNLNKKISDLLDKGINSDVSRQLLKEDPLETKTDLLLAKICDGIVSLLRKWPDQKYKLHAFLNQPLPQPIRFVGWNVFLSNHNHRNKFLKDLSTNPRSILSPMDAEIQRNCDAFMATLPAGPSMADSRGNMSSMKAILSYHHSSLGNKRDLAESEYYYTLPIVLSHNPPLPRNEKPYEKSLSILIEMYLTFLDILPPPLIQSHLNSTTQDLEPWFRKVEFHLKEIDRPVYNHLRMVLYPQGAQMANSDDPYIALLLKKCCYPWFKFLFVGCLNVDPLMYVWDQYIITSDLPNFHDELIPAIAAAMIITLRDFILQCKLTSDLETVLQKKTNIIVTRQLQSVIVRFFLNGFKERIAKSDFGPVIDPTEGRHIGWTEFSRDRVPHIDNRPEQRLNNRDKNEHALLLEKRLREEMAKRVEGERLMQSKIDQLQREVDQMRMMPQTKYIERIATPQYPVERYIVNSKPPSVVPYVHETPRAPSKIEPMHDLLQKVAQTFNKVAHSEGTNNVALNEQTKSDVRVHKLDLKMAEKQVFGRTLQSHEWDNLPTTQKDHYSQQMLNAVKNRIQNRYSSIRK